MGAEDHEPTGRLTSADRVAVIIGCAALLAGVLTLSLTSGTVAEVIGICLVGLSGIAFVSLAFLLVGESEDRQYHDGSP